MLDVLTNHFPILDEVSEEQKEKFPYFIIANKDGKVALSARVRLKNFKSLLEEFDVEITPLLEKMAYDATSGWLVELESLKTDAIRFYSGGEGLIVDGPDFVFPEHESYDRVFGSGFIYQPSTDSILEYKKYYVNEDKDQFTQFKYTPDGDETGPFVEIGGEGVEDFNDTIGIVPELQALEGIRFYSTSRLDVDQTYLHVMT